MGFFKKLGGLFSSSGKPDDMVMWVSVKCQRCGEIISTRIDLRNELSVEFEGDGPPTYFCRKEVMGDKGLCFQRIEIELTFDAKRNLLQREINGGSFVDTATPTS